MSKPGRDEAAVHEFVEQMALTLSTWGFPRMASRVLVTMMSAEDDALSAGELAERLDVSPAAISGAVRYLTQFGIVERVPVRGSRRDYYRLPDDAWYVASYSKSDLFETVQKLTSEGTAALGGPATRAGARVAEMGEFFAFAYSRMDEVMRDWKAQRDSRAARGVSEPR